MNLSELVTFLRDRARHANLGLALNTHYDAGNCELRWWDGSTLHRLDFQPLDAGELAITHYRDRFARFPRFLNWAHSNIPLFPYLADIRWERLDTLQFPVDESRIQALIAQAQGASRDPAANTL